MSSFVLVHGGSHAAWCWEDMVGHLNRPALAVDLPGRGADPRQLRRLTAGDFVDAVTGEIERADLRDVVLVGHSLAGVVVPAVCARIPERIAALVLMAAAVAPPGGRIVDLLPAPVRILSLIQHRFGVRSPALPRALARRAFCNDMSPEQARRTLDRLVPEAVQLVVEPVPRPALPPRLPVIYIRFTRDRIITPDRASVMIENLGGAEVVDLDAGHDGMISRPELVAAALNAVSRERSGS
ncbi:alpha/beta fold hydrolase [Streptomyces sp. NPDC056660]|uniref:alpha/beta fold hydrolase n=1 Tax=Streptomyces sp. NPDC056660 TaxID=3345897 RepID=UPI0036C896AD